LIEDKVSVAPLYTGLDGGMNKAFRARFPGNVVSFASVSACISAAAPARWVDNDGSLASKLFGTSF
jgi:hypothetical protein